MLVGRYCSAEHSDSADHRSRLSDRIAVSAFRHLNQKTLTFRPSWIGD